MSRCDINEASEIFASHATCATLSDAATISDAWTLSDAATLSEIVASDRVIGPTTLVCGCRNQSGVCVCVLQVGMTFDYANRVGARFVALIAPDEWSKKMVPSRL